jgi:hypothetical protein
MNTEDKCNARPSRQPEPYRDNSSCCNSEVEPALTSQPKIRQINIKQLSLGYIVQVGCQEFAIETSEKLLVGLATYLKDPQGTEKAWFDGKFLK